MKNLPVAFLLAGCLAAAGCTFTAGSSKVHDVGSYLSLQKGESTKRDVHAKFGQPNDVQPTDQGSAWFYVSIVMRTSGWTFVPVLGLAAGGYDVDSTQAIQLRPK